MPTSVGDNRSTTKDFSWLLPPTSRDTRLEDDSLSLLHTRTHTHTHTRRRLIDFIQACHVTSEVTRRCSLAIEAPPGERTSTPGKQERASPSYTGRHGKCEHPYRIRVQRRPRGTPKRQWAVPPPSGARTDHRFDGGAVVWRRMTILVGTTSMRWRYRQIIDLSCRNTRMSALTTPWRRMVSRRTGSHLVTA